MIIVEEIKINIFYLHEDPKLCAQYHVDRHTVKMILEYAQLLSTAHRVLDGKVYVDSSGARKATRWRLEGSKEELLYKSTHVHHPSSVWARESIENYNWLYALWIELMSEYTFRYNKQHACSKLINVLKNPPQKINSVGRTPIPQAMPDIYKVNGDSITAYRNYYRGDKIRFAKWKNREAPLWFVPL